MKKNNKKSHLRLVKKNKKRENKIRMNKHKDKFIKQKKKVLDIRDTIEMKVETIVSVEQFRQNLTDLYMTVSVRELKENDSYNEKRLIDNGIVMKYDLSLLNDDQEFLDVWTSDIRHLILIDDISSVDDIYTLTNTGFSRLGDKNYVPKRDDPILTSLFPYDYDELNKTFVEHIESGKSPSYFYGYFYSQSHIDFVENLITDSEYSKEQTESKYYPVMLSDMKMRHLFVIQFGLFSGYDYSLNWTKKKMKQYMKTLNSTGDVMMDSRESQRIVEIRKSPQDEDLYELSVPLKSSMTNLILKSTSSKLLDLLKNPSKFKLSSSPTNDPNSPNLMTNLNDYQRNEIIEFVESGRGGRHWILENENETLKNEDHHVEPNRDLKYSLKK